MPTCAPYDALLLVSFGGPEKPADVVPFLQNVTRGRNIPTERLAEVGEHYYSFGGRSPLNDLNRDFIEAVAADFAEHEIDLPIYWGNRNWDPYLPEALRQMAADGVQRALCLFTSAYSSYSGCRQYRENLAAAVAEVEGAPALDRLRHYFNHPGFVTPNIEATVAALAELPTEVRDEAVLLFVTHSIPVAMNDVSGGGPGSEGYTTQHDSVVTEVTRGVTERTGVQHPSELTFCSRSGPAEVPWLEPDVGDRIEELAQAGTRAVVVVPIGFVADHMEVIYDLDTEAREVAQRHRVAFARAATAGVAPAFVGMVRELVLERVALERGAEPAQPRVGELAASWTRCPAGCCANPRGPVPALIGSD